MKLLLLSFLVLVTYKDHDIQCMLRNVNNKVSGVCSIFVDTKAEAVSCTITKNTILLPYKARYAVVNEKDECIELGFGWGSL